jgi:hypothetical protein
MLPRRFYNNFKQLKSGEIIMKKRMKFITIIMACLLALVMTSNGFSADTAKGRKTISDAERALAMWQVQNVMSKHAHYHAAGMHLEELANIWVDEKGPNADTATFASPGWIMHGIAGVKKFYGQGNQDNKVKELEAVSKLYPEIKNVPENLGVGHEYAMHTNTTPIIEVAGDGKTAKGTWYSPGMGLSAHINGTNVTYGGTFFWEKYGADFMKENGEWKIWHCQMWYDWTPSFPESMTSSIGAGPGGAPAAGGQAQGGQAQGAPGGQGGAPAGAPAGAPGGQGGDKGGKGAVEAGEQMKGQADVSSAKPGDMTANPYNKYQTYSVKRVPTIAPKFPEPYYTFSETFSY